MKNLENYKFNLSVSTTNYLNKNTINWGQVKYNKQQLSINDFENRIKEGYTFCYCFDDNDEVFNQSIKTLNNYRYTNLIMVDIDDSTIDMNDFVEQLQIKPTISYTTANNYSVKSNYTYRFRLCFLFEEKIVGIENYLNMYNSIINMISNSISSFSLKDNCAQSANQQFAGNGNLNIILNNSYLVYSLNDFLFNTNFPFKINIKRKGNTLLFLNGKKDNTNKKKQNNKKEIEIKDIEFINDLNNLKQSDLINKYKERYEYFTSTPLHYNDMGYALIPSDYLSIYRSWHKVDFQKENGDRIEFTAVKRFKDGDGRRKKLFIAALIMKKILPTIQYEHLLYNLINERYYYYNNSDKQLSNEVLSSIANTVVNIPIEDIKLNSKPNKAKFRVDTSYCQELNMTANQYKQLIKKEMNNEVIGSNYDCSISLKENIKFFKENGIKIGKTKLYEWCKENGIETNPNKKTKKQNMKKEIEVTNTNKIMNTNEEKKEEIKVEKRVRVKKDGRLLTIPQLVKEGLGYDDIEEITEAITADNTVSEHPIVNDNKVADNAGKRVNTTPPTGESLVKVGNKSIPLNEFTFTLADTFFASLSA